MHRSSHSTAFANFAAFPASAALALQARRWGWPVAAALGLHAWLLWGLPSGTSGPAEARSEGPPRAVVVQTRTMAAAPRPAAATAAASPAYRAPAAAPLPPPPPPTRRTKPSAPALARESVPPAQPAPTDAPTAQSPAPGSLEDPSALESEPSPLMGSEPAAGDPLPLYTTQMAPPATLQFTMKRGPSAGIATLRWQPDIAANRYALRIEAQAFSLPPVEWSSSGGFDQAGLAPERYTESRRRRPARAVNFQRAAGKVSFSAHSAEYPLLPGMQDRHSWLVQLGAILQANPALAQAEAQISMLVVGLRGELEPWVFTVVERGPMPVGAGGARVTAIHLRREPSRPHGLRAEVWLDPAQHHLPLKFQLLAHASGEGPVFELQQLSFP